MFKLLGLDRPIRSYEEDCIQISCTILKLGFLFAWEIWIMVCFWGCEANGDATQKFEEVGHSSTAFSMMEGYLIGVVDGYEGSAGDGGAQKTKEAVAGGPVRARTLQERKPPSSSSFLDLLLPVLILGLAFGAWYYLTFYSKAKA